MKNTVYKVNVEYRTCFDNILKTSFIIEYAINEDDAKRITNSRIRLHNRDNSNQMYDSKIINVEQI